MCKKFLRFDRAFFRRYRGLLLLIVSVGILEILAHLYEPRLVALGERVVARYHQSGLYFVLFALSAASSTLLPGPVWIYVFIPTAMGFPHLGCSLVVAFGSVLGSASSYILGRWYRKGAWFERAFSHERLSNWEGRSRLWMGTALFTGSISPIPMDLFYFASGGLRFPALSFLLLVTVGRIIRYVLIGYGFYALR